MSGHTRLVHIGAALRERGLFNAYVTVDNYDWAVDGLASKALAERRTIDLTNLGQLYVETIVEHFLKLASSPTSRPRRGWLDWYPANMHGEDPTL